MTWRPYHLIGGMLAVNMCRAFGLGAPSVITLQSSSCSIAIDPASLKTTMTSKDRGALLISTGQDNLGDVEAVVEHAGRAHWRLPHKAVEVSMGLDGAMLTVEIRSDGPGAFTWPVIPLVEPTEALVWPHWEGRYIPLDDPVWSEFLRGQEWDTLEGLAMPFWGLYGRDGSLTYIATERFHNAIHFEARAEGPLLRFTHEFSPAERNWSYGFVITLTDSASPVEPARIFRRWLEQQNAYVPMSAKLHHVPKAERLRGALHAYVWGDSFLSRHDLKSTAWREFCATLVRQAAADGPAVGKRVQALMSPTGWKQVEAAAAAEWPDRYMKTEIAAALSNVLEKESFYEPAAWADASLPADLRRRLDSRDEKPNIAATCRLNGMLLRAAFPDLLRPVEDWGDGVSLKLLRALKEAGLDRVRLCVAGWEGVERRPEVAEAADELGYLFGTYDSFHSIHDPAVAGTDATWPTAQFDRELFEAGAIHRRDGTKRRGFKQRGYLLSPRAARPWVERRVRQNMQNARFNHYFVDCDAFGSVYDDYAPLHPATQADDAAARVDRLGWIGVTFGAVVGSEGGSSYAAPVVHLVEGMLTPVIGWNDPELKDKTSPYYRGAYYPPDGPRVFVETVPLKDKYVHLHYDPRFRLPLNEIVFHDSLVSTHHWSAGSLKFANVRRTVALTEMLYQCPPLYHLSVDELARQLPWIKEHDAHFAGVHRKLGFSRMTGFAWLSPDRLVQRTVFEDGVEIVANFSEAEFAEGPLRVPAWSVIVRGLPGGDPPAYAPRPMTAP